MFKNYFIIVLLTLALAVNAIEELQLIGTINYPVTESQEASFAEWRLIKGVYPASDINNDGYSDFVYPLIDGYSYELGIWYGGQTINPNPDLTLQVQQNIPINTDIGYSSDLNNDGYVDLIRNTALPLHSSVSLYHGPFFDDLTIDHTHSFSASERYDLYQPGDINGDGVDDLIAYYDYTYDSLGHVWIMFGNSSENYTTDMDIYGFIDYEDYHNCYHVGKNVFSGDVNGDGVNDLFYSKLTNNITEYKLLPGGNTLGSVTLDFDSSIWQCSANGDFNGDGCNDVIAIDMVGDLRIYYGASDFSFTSDSIRLNSNETRSQNIRAFYSDINTDGLDDILILDTHNRNIEIYLGGAQLNSTPDYIIPTVENSEYFTSIGINAGDMNGDGFNDVLVNRGGDNTTLYLYSLIPVSNDDQVAVNKQSISSYPNPFRQSTTIEAKGMRGNLTDVIIYNIRGEVVRSIKSNGSEKIDWDGKNNHEVELPSGIYFYKAISKGDKSSFKKMLKLK